MRPVLDTDVMVSAFRSWTGASRLLLRAALKGELPILLSVPLLLQYEEVLTRPEHLAVASADRGAVHRILDALCAVAELVEIAFVWRPALKDPTDEMVLETAVNGQASHILTFNKRDFVGAERFGIVVSQPGPAWRAWMEKK